MPPNSPGGRLWAGRLFLLAAVPRLVLAYMPILAEPRFHIPLVPSLAPYAAMIWTERRLHRRFRSLKSSLQWSAAGLTIMLAVVWIWEFARDIDKLQLILGPDRDRLYVEY
jgi:hypothetical protein